MYDTARKIENNLVMYWCLSRNDKKVTDFRKEMQCVQDVGLYVVLVYFATGVYGCSRECGATNLCWRQGAREGGGGGGSDHSSSQPKILELSHILSPVYLAIFTTKSGFCLHQSRAWLSICRSIQKNPADPKKILRNRHDCDPRAENARSSANH